MDVEEDLEMEEKPYERRPSRAPPAPAATTATTTRSRSRTTMIAPPSTALTATATPPSERRRSLRRRTSDIVHHEEESTPHPDPTNPPPVYPTSTSAPTSDPRATCPKCGISIGEAFINLHLDTCLNRGIVIGAASSSPASASEFASAFVPPSSSQPPRPRSHDPPVPASTPLSRLPKV